MGAVEGGVLMDADLCENCGEPGPLAVTAEGDYACGACMFSCRTCGQRFLYESAGRDFCDGVFECHVCTDARGAGA